VSNDLGDKVKELLKGTGNFEIRRVDIVGPKVGGELRQKGMMAMIMSILAILLYVAFRFEWRFAIAFGYGFGSRCIYRFGGNIIFSNRCKFRCISGTFDASWVLFE